MELFSHLHKIAEKYAHDGASDNQLGASYHHCSDCDADLALALSSLRFFPLFHEEIKLTKEKYGSVPRVYIVCDQDLTIGEDVQRWMIKENPPHEVKMINGSDHMPMFSKSQEFFSTLQEISDQYS
ncbi:hypothetical protein ACE6H2_024500 [Prunus campanulata]